MSAIETITPERLETLVLSAIHTPDDLATAHRLGLTGQHFVLPHHAHIWAFITERVEKTGSIPTPAALKELGLDYVDDIEDIEPWAQRLADETLGARISHVLAEIAQQKTIQSEPREALKGLITSLDTLAEEAKTTDNVLYVDADAKLMFEDAKDRVEMRDLGMPIGVPTGLPLFDEDGWGWQPGDIITIMGPMGIGKSSLMTYFCSVAYKAGKKILYLSPENTRQTVVQRSHIFLSRLDDGHNWNFKDSALAKGTIDLEAYNYFTEELSARRDWAVVDSGARGAFTIDDVLQLSREHKPDILAIDGFHLVGEVGAKAAKWEQMQAAAQQLKGHTLANQMVVFAVGQTIRNDLEWDDALPEARHAAYGFKSLLEAADRNLTMAKHNNNKSLRRFGCMKFRRGPNLEGKSWLIEFDPDLGLIKEQTIGDSTQAGF